MVPISLIRGLSQTVLNFGLKSILCPISEQEPKSCQVSTRYLLLFSHKYPGLRRGFRKIEFHVTEIPTYSQHWLPLWPKYPWIMRGLWKTEIHAGEILLHVATTELIWNGSRQCAGLILNLFIPKNLGFRGIYEKLEFTRDDLYSKFQTNRSGIRYPR